MIGTDEDVGTCWDEACGATEIEHRWQVDMVRLKTLDEWKCNECGLRWARWSEPVEAA